MKHEANVQLAPQHPLVGTVFEGRYKVLEVLFEDEDATTLKAVREDLEQVVTLIALNPSRDTAAARAQFQRSVRATASVRHPNVISIFDCAPSSAAKQFYVTEFVHERRFSELVATDGRVELPQALTLFRQLCMALAAAHEQGVIHGSLDSDDVVLSRRARQTESVSVGGFSRLISECSATDAQDYIRADMLALGKLGFTLFAGRREGLAAEGDVEPAWSVGALRGVPASMRTLIEKLLTGQGEAGRLSMRDIVQGVDMLILKEGGQLTRSEIPKPLGSIRREKHTGPRPPVRPQGLDESPVAHPPPRQRPLGRSLFQTDTGTRGVALVLRASLEDLELMCFVDGTAPQEGSVITLTFPRAMGTGSGSFSIDADVATISESGRAFAMVVVVHPPVHKDFAPLVGLWKTRMA